ncbi:hypothetical protein ACROYT_G041409 [Oculina patagonica]
MESGAILDSQITATSVFGANHEADKARLHRSIGAGSWVAGTNNVNQWIQVDLLNDDTKVTGVATQGRNADHHWVTGYRLSYCNEGASAQFYREQGQSGTKVFDGNTDRHTVVYHDVLNPPITARYIRFHPVTWNGHIAMRVELYDCSLQGNVRVNSPHLAGTLTSVSTLATCDLQLSVKSDLMKCMEKLTPNQSITPVVDVMLIDGTAPVNILKPSGTCKTFSGYAYQMHIICRKSVTSYRVCSRLISSGKDAYQTRDKRGRGVRRRVEADVRLPDSWGESLKEESNKTELIL